MCYVCCMCICNAACVNPKQERIIEKKRKRIGKPRIEGYMYSTSDAGCNAVGR